MAPSTELLAARLDELEPSPTRWRADPPGSLTPVLEAVGGAESALEPHGFLAELRMFLATAEPAWDPFPLG